MYGQYTSSLSIFTHSTDSFNPSMFVYIILLLPLEFIDIGNWNLPKKMLFCSSMFSMSGRDVHTFFNTLKMEHFSSLSLSPDMYCCGKMVSRVSEIKKK